MRVATALLTAPPLALAGALTLLFTASSSGCLSSGVVPRPDGGSNLFLPDGAPFVPVDGSTISCVFEELDTFSCADETLAPPVWVTNCLDDDDCRTRVNNTSSRAGCTDTTQFANVQVLMESCAQWEQSGQSLPPIDSGPPSVCAPGSVASFKPSWHPPRAPTQSCTKAQIDSYGQCLTDSATTFNPPSCAEWNGTPSPADATCLACLTSNEPDPQYGPYVLLPTALLINVGGCVALAEAKTDGSGCGGAISADQGCDRAACLSTCSVGSPSLVAKEAACEQAANVLPSDAGTGGACASYALAAECETAVIAGDAGTAAQQCFGGGQDASASSVFEAVGLAFCGGL